jgi:hypothetical protein
MQDSFNAKSSDSFSFRDMLTNILYVQPQMAMSSIKAQNFIPYMKCGVCQEPIKMAGVLDCCKHEFCFHCINKWKKESTTCPICRQDFKTLTKTKFGRVIKIEKVFPKNQPIPSGSFYDENYHNVAYNCEICLENVPEHELLICCMCEHQACHLECDGLLEIPIGIWKCHTCRMMNNLTTY